MLSQGERCHELPQMQWPKGFLDCQSAQERWNEAESRACDSHTISVAQDCRSHVTRQEGPSRVDALFGCSTNNGRDSGGTVS
jgi:hypothetical protein